MEKFQIKNRSGNAFSLVEVLVGTFLILIIFLGLFGLYQLALKVIAQSERKITATALANREMEKIRNLSYSEAGTIGAILPMAEGSLEVSTTTTQNKIDYLIERKIKYVVDGADGTGGSDSCNWDYKRAEIKVSWSGRFSGSVRAISDLAPKDIVEESRACISQPGGILSVSVSSEAGAMVASPLIEIFNPSSGALVDFATPLSGEYDFPLATGTYKIAVSKSGFSQERTYGTNEVAIPEKPHPLVLIGEVTETSFLIDELASFSVNTLSPWGQSQFEDPFSDETKISGKTNVLISGGQADLATDTEGYLALGNLFSVEIAPSSIIEWDEFSFEDSEPENTDLKYQIYFATSGDWALIPETDLAGNTVGFDSSPVNLSDLSTTTYDQLKLKANFSTNSTSSTPLLFAWQVSWRTLNPTPIAQVGFRVRGEKIIGLDEQEQPVYKYSQGFVSDFQGNRNISSLETDNYTFSLATPTNLDLISTDPGPQPLALAPNSSVLAKLYLRAENSLLVTVENFETLEPVFSASVRMSSGFLGYDKTQNTDSNGQTYFIPLDSATYTLEVQAVGFLATTSQASVSGDGTKIIKLQQVE